MNDQNIKNINISSDLFYIINGIDNIKVGIKNVKDSKEITENMISTPITSSTEPREHSIVNSLCCFVYTLTLK